VKVPSTLSPKRRARISLATWELDPGTVREVVIVAQKKKSSETKEDGMSYPEAHK
jgi:hypothetical protein